MKEYVIDNGFIQNYECWCGGIHRIEFVSTTVPGAIVKIYPEKNKWRASRKGRKIGSGFGIDTLKPVIDALVS